MFKMLHIVDVNTGRYNPFDWDGKTDTKYFAIDASGRNRYLPMCIADTPENRELLDTWATEYKKLKNAMDVGQHNTESKLKKWPEGYKDAATTTS